MKRKSVLLRLLFVGLALVLALSLTGGLGCGGTTPSQQQGEEEEEEEEEPEVLCTIIRDDYGVPHVFADIREGLSFGTGYAM